LADAAPIRTAGSPPGMSQSFAVNAQSEATDHVSLETYRTPATQMQPMEIYYANAAVLFAARHVEEFRSCQTESIPMGISDSYLTHLVAIIEPQAIYHPRLPAPFPSDTYGAQASSIPATSEVLASSGSAGSPRHYLVDVHA
jgi:hypothetical protein